MPPATDTAARGAKSVRGSRRGGPRLSADERRAQVVRAAVTEFARGGYAGTSTEDVAARAEISQPYLFRLFGTKRDLFIATMEVMHARIEETFRAAAAGKSGFEAMAAMGAAYQELLLSERDLLLVQLHSYAASDDEKIRAAARRGFRHLWAAVEQLTAAPDDDVRAFFAQGMLLNVLAAMDASAVDESWVRACTPDPHRFLAHRATS